MGAYNVYVMLYPHNYVSAEKLDRAVAEYDLGRKHLANIMGIDDDNMSQEDVRVSCYKYLV